MNFRWEWEVFLRDTGGGQTYLEWLMSAWGWTLSVAACAWVVAFVLGSVVGTLRTTPNPWLVRLGNAWVELFRNIPLLVQIFLWYHVVPAMFPILKSVPSFL
ncbi:MAG: ABC transporter permease subunit, partial [Proteobacteria bacterium]|nr:ABC transporter permease subunit [Pseudomonadota bacterium]